MPQGPGTYGSKVGRPPAEEKSPAEFKPYTPFRMKAADYGNSPMRKNYGQFGVGSSESPRKVSPLQAQKGRNVSKTVATAESGAAGAEGGATLTGTPGGTASAGPMFGAQAGAVGKGGVAMHGDESHQGGGAIGGGVAAGTEDLPGASQPGGGRPGKKRGSMQEKWREKFGMKSAAQKQAEGQGSAGKGRKGDPSGTPGGGLDKFNPPAGWN